MGVHFPYLLQPASQRQFDLATSRLHSLRFNEFRAHLQRDREDGAGMRHCILGDRDKPDQAAGAGVFVFPMTFASGREAFDRPRPRGPRHRRERAYIAALALLFDEHGAAQWDHGTIAYEQAMAFLAAGEPDDEEAKIFYALALNMVPRALDKDFALTDQGHRTAVGGFGEQPHPGLSHYLTYCLRAPDEEVPESPVSRRIDSFHDRSVSAALTLSGVGMFFVAIWPAWSPPRW